MITAHIPEDPGAVSFGKTIGEVRDRVMNVLQELLIFRTELSLSEPVVDRESIVLEPKV